jgi:translation elongation factor EF-G
MGPLHLETVTKTIQERGVDVEVSSPSSVFHESVDGASDFHEAQSPNKKNWVKMKVSRLDQTTIEYLRKAKSTVLQNE